MIAALRCRLSGCGVGRAKAVYRIVTVDVRPRSWSRAALLSTRSYSTAQLPPPPLMYPDSLRSSKHHDISSFLRHAERTGLDPGSTTYVGTHYEYTVAEHSKALGFSLRRVGGASDRGIDLLGTWTLPIPTESGKHRHPVRVLLQCKAGAGQRVGPYLVRELEGAFIGAPVGWKSRVGHGSNNSESGDGFGDVSAVIGLLVTEKPATKGIRDALGRSRWPMAYICCSSTGQLKQMLWNQSAEKGCGLTGLGVTLRHSADVGEGVPHAHIILTWQGKPLPQIPSQGI